MRQKTPILLCRECRGEQCSPANLTQQRFFGKASHMASGHGRTMCAPTRHFYDSLPHGVPRHGAVRQKTPILLCRECRGEQCSPANPTQQRFFGKASHMASGHGRTMCAPTRHFYDSLPHGVPRHGNFCLVLGAEGLTGLPGPDIMNIEKALRQAVGPFGL